MPPFSRFEEIFNAILNCEGIPEYFREVILSWYSQNYKTLTNVFPQLEDPFVFWGELLRLRYVPEEPKKWQPTFMNDHRWFTNLWK